MKHAYLIIAACLLSVAACRPSAQKQADALLREAQSAFRQGQYQLALTLIDSLRSSFPKAIDARKEALVLWQRVELKRAQTTVQLTEQELRSVRAEHDSLRMLTDQLLSRGQATAQQLRQVNALRVRRDSLQTRFDVECAKIRYIHKRQKEVH